MKKLVVFVTVILAALFVFSETIKIGVVLPMTGGISAFGRMTWEGIQIAYQLKPEVQGKKVELVLLDNRSEKTEAAQAVERAISKEHVVAIIGEIASAHSLAGGAVAEKHKVPMVSPASTNPLVTQGKKYVSRVCFIDPFQGAAAAKFAYEKLGARTAVIFTDVEQDYSVGLSNFFRNTFTKLGGRVYFEFYRTGDQEFSAQLTDALAKNPDVLYITGYYPEIALFSRQARLLGYTGHILAGDGAEAPELIEIGGEAVEGLYFTTHFHAKGAATPKTKEFVRLYKEKYGKEPSALAALGFDAYLILVDAIERAGSTEPDAIAKAVRQTKKFEGATGYITINENGDAIKPVVVDVVRNGEFDFETIVNVNP